MLKIFEYLAIGSALAFSICLIALMFFYGSPSSAPQSPQQQHSEENKAVEHHSEAEKPFWEKATTDPVAAFTLFLVIFTAILSAVGVIQLKMLTRAETVSEKTAQAAKDSADAANKAAVVAEKTLIAGQRAWIRIDEIGVGGGALVFDQNGASVSISFRVTNIGNIPATNITVHAWMVALKNGKTSAVQDQKRLCEEVRSHPFFAGFALFPNEAFPASMGLGGWSLGTNVSSEEIAEGVEISADKKHILLQVFGCVDYTFATDPTVHHQTGFIRELRRKGPVMLSPNDGMIPKDQLTLVSDSFGFGQYAD
jgi:hypothetical protein